MTSILKNKIVVSLIFAVLVFLAIGGIVFAKLLQPTSSSLAKNGPTSSSLAFGGPTLDKNQENFEFIISSGSGVSKIASDLRKQDLIKSVLAFKIYSFFSGSSLVFKPGVYLLNKNFSIPEIINILVSGPKVIEAMIVPGMTIKEIDDYLSKLKIVKVGEILNLKVEKFKIDFSFLSQAKTLEGFLMPDTYFFFPESEPDLVVSKILANFKDKVIKSEGDLQIFKDSGNLNKLVLASLLEKEIPDYKERQIAAGILEKRIKSGMPLQIDATVIYASCGGKFAGCQLDRQDFKTDSPYNTYKYFGYPPAPICNPSIESIKAALSPIKSDYWYYLSDPITKKTIFSKTLDEHTENRVKYLY